MAAFVAMPDRESLKNVDTKHLSQTTSTAGTNSCWPNLDLAAINGYVTRKLVVCGTVD